MTTSVGDHGKRPETTPPAVEPLAVRIADTLLAKSSVAALGRAAAVRDMATAKGNIAQADLFAAVCSIIMWRDGVLKRLQAPQGDRQ